MKRISQCLPFKDIQAKRTLVFAFLFCTVLLFCSVASFAANSDTTFYKLKEMGIRANQGVDMVPIIEKILNKIKDERNPQKPVVIIFEPGRYNFHPQDAIKKELYISNHDQDNPKSVGILLQDWENVTIDASGSDFIFHGRMLPIAIRFVKNFALKNVHIDFELPQICQASILENDTINRIVTLQIAPWVKYKIEDSVFYNTGEGWQLNPSSGIAFENKSKHIVYNTSDLRIPLRKVVEVKPGVIQVFNWKNKQLLPGMVLAMRSWQRPAPGILLDQGKDVCFENVKVHYAEGMGLLAQVSENITLNNFGVSLRGKNDPRYFTTQADATHFSGCKGKIISTNGLYEGMMDDAINIHGTYLKVQEVKNKTTLVAEYMHSQSFGFQWGNPGDKVQFIASKTMEVIGNINAIKSIEALNKPTYFGASKFLIEFEKPLAVDVLNGQNLGIENLTWTPEVYFKGNVIRNNRARGALFSTPKKTVVESNFFDHTSGAAILLCGDCNGWFETGACHSVIIKNNRFVNALTNMFQFTNAIISIYPEIPDLKNQKKYFHSNIVIEGNTFETFDKPLVYAKSVDGLTFKNNKISYSTEYPAFHWNHYPFLFERVVNYKFSNNKFPQPFDISKDLKNTLP